MNKQELIKHIRALPYSKGPLKDTAEVNRGWLLRNIDQLDEPEKVKVPQVVADWIEYFKKCSGTFYGSTVPYSCYGRAITDDFEGNVKETLGWIRNNSESYARAWLDGYEVEEEPKYTVKIKSTKCSTNSLVFSESTGAWFFSVTTYHGVRFKHTRKQLEEADFGWVFDCDGVGVEEVEW